ncbi:hypothetical protein M1K46_10340 [Fictibacillus sp. WQ 8-8]|uniref:hypothetical protein n=1 Tax=unclassified Fictibacillus TaxID=2644029 RepID=UPI0006A7A761|nr:MULTISPECIES: hypothetical protein [unclassified Fictibacillus]MCQ6266061.1 hypothetical protein [Fictibacillus sp. WQ 8-8]MED2972719.1 hypothetical protein [Fictibacillus sp. B-59209]SFD72735.1 hypothetical protein SAMN05428981_1011618 [Bacillus sp. OV194]
MTLLKIKTKSLVLNKDLRYNEKLGLPVEVYCPNSHRTIAFGRIETMDDHFVVINSEKHSIADHFFFGCPSAI